LIEILRLIILKKSILNLLLNKTKLNILGKFFCGVAAFLPQAKLGRCVVFTLNRSYPQPCSGRKKVESVGQAGKP